MEPFFQSKWFAPIAALVTFVVAGLTLWFTARLWWAESRSSRSANLIAYIDKRNKEYTLAIENTGRSVAVSIEFQIKGKIVIPGFTEKLRTITELEPQGRRVVEVPGSGLGAFPDEIQITWRDRAGSKKSAVSITK